MARPVAEVANLLGPPLKNQGFRKVGQTFNLRVERDLVQVINVQGSKWGDEFTVNLGIYLREVDRFFDDWIGIRNRGAWDEKVLVSEPDCYLRWRLSQVLGQENDRWWPYAGLPKAAWEVSALLTDHALPFLRRFSSRPSIISEWKSTPNSLGMFGPRDELGIAVLLRNAGQVDEARDLALRKLRESEGHPSHPRILQLVVALGYNPSSE